MLTHTNRIEYSVADPYPYYHWLRSNAPVYQVSENAWMVTRYDDAAMLLGDKRCSHWGQDNNAFQQMNPMEREIAKTLHALAPGSEPAFRKQIMHQLAGRSNNIDAQHMQSQANDILNGLKASNEIDFMQHYAHPFTFGAICRVMGVAEEDIDGLSHIVAGMKGSYLRFVSTEAMPMNDEGLLFLEAMQKLVRLKQQQPASDLCSSILAVCPLDETNEPFIVSLVVLLFYAGHLNMMNFMGNAILALQHRLNEQAQIRNSLSLAIESVDEFIRYDSSLQTIMLVAKEDIPLHGKLITAGSQLLINVGAANRDPAKFHDPDALILSRKPLHLGFGTGPFRCVGARLAQIQGGVGLHCFLKHVGSYTTVQEGVNWGNYLVQRGPSSVPLKINWNHGN